ncbi:MAG: alpha/beta hydrolase [Actinobacteria bacterium]|nr:alpha/beta hydrolase [Actinomycetota bacterium]MCA1721385.1 alpha/beta hydrolase [Actinomycetota bacterium]
MPLDPPIAAVLQMLADSGSPMSMIDGTPEQAREGFRTMTVGARDAAALPQVRSIEDSTTDGGIPIRIYRPEADGPVPTVVFFHGGGFVIGDIETHDDHTRLICKQVEAVVVSVDYRLAPEHPFPAGFEDCLAATRWVADNIAQLGGDADRIAVAGDSAGGNLAAAVALACKADGPPLAAQLLIYPGVDFRDEDLHPSRIENGEGLFLTAEDMRWFGNHYLSDPAHRQDPRASVLVAPDLTGLPPAVVGTGEYDPLRDEGEAYAKALEQAGVKVVQRRYDGLIHGFFGMGAWSPASAAAAADLCEELRALLA